MKKNITIVVVLYNSFPKDYNHILDKYENVHMVIVDNTPGRDLCLSKNNLVYIPLKDNMGIAYALNVGCRYAIEKNDADWILTLDQDSVVPMEMIQEYFRYIDANEGKKIGLLCPLIDVYYGEQKIKSDSIVEIDVAITSGSMINTLAYQEIGGFKDELFIDEVDTEFCLNLRSHGYHLFQLNYVLMQHQVGNCKEYTFMGKHLFYVLHHNYIRHYYMQRNSMYVADMYSDIFPSIKKSKFQLILPFLKILLFENDKIQKIVYRYKGYLDYKKGKFGKI